MIEIIITTIIIVTAIYLLSKNIYQKASGKCKCEGCSKCCSRKN